MPLIGFIGRLDFQKGADLVLAVVPWHMQQDVQLVCLGTGDPGLEARVLWPPRPCTLPAGMLGPLSPCSWRWRCTLARAEERARLSALALAALVVRRVPTQGMAHIMVRASGGVLRLELCREA